MITYDRIIVCSPKKNRPHTQKRCNKTNVCPEVYIINEFVQDVNLLELTFGLLGDTRIDPVVVFFPAVYSVIKFWMFLSIIQISKFKFFSGFTFPDLTFSHKGFS